MCGAVRINSLPLASMEPHSAVGGEMPRPIKLRLAQLRIALPILMVTRTIIGARQLGMICLTMMFRSDAPAARAAGASDLNIIVKHIIPNCLAPMIVRVTMSIGSAILSCASLSFIGLGISPPTAEWGSMLASGREFIRTAPHICTFPGLAIMLTVFSLNLMGDGIRDAFDPKMKT